MDAIQLISLFSNGCYAICNFSNSSWSFSEIVWYLFIYGVIGVCLVEIRRRKKKKSNWQRNETHVHLHVGIFGFSIHRVFLLVFSPFWGEDIWVSLRENTQPHHFFLFFSSISPNIKIFSPLFSHQFFIFPKIPPNKHTLKLARLPTLAKFSILFFVLNF